MDEGRDDDDDESEEGGGIPTDVLKSYVAFAVRAIAKRRLLVLLVFALVSVGVLGGVAIWPRTYHCEAKLIATQSQVLATRGDTVNDALRGAADVITRRENLEAVVKQTDLIKLWKEHRPPALRLKDGIMAKLRGPMSDRDSIGGLIWTLENNITVEASFGDGTLTVGVDWSDGPSAAQVVQALVDNYLESRHVAEISTIAEYASILEGHASTLRGEVDTIAKQIQEMRREKVASATRRNPSDKATDAPHLPVRRVAAAPRAEADTDAELPGLKVMLEAKQRTMKELEEYRTRRLLDLQNKLADLETRFTEAHPAVLDAKQNISVLSKESPQVTTLRAEVKDLEAEVQRRSSATKLAAGTGSGLLTAAMPGKEPSGAEPLSAEVMSLMQESMDELDPAVMAQLRYAVDKFSSLRGQISSARIDLDTAHAAFKHRYKIVVPPEVPEKPTKPKVTALIGAGLVGAVVIALLAALVAELRTGRIVERWQVDQIALPVLGELRFPPRPPDA